MRRKQVTNIGNLKSDFPAHYKYITDNDHKANAL